MEHLPNEQSENESYSHSDIDNERLTLIDPFTKKAYPSMINKFKSASTYQANPNFQYLDNIIETIKFSKYHIATFLVCAFSIMSSGFVTTHYIFSKNLLIQKYSWTLTGYSVIFIFQNIVGACGAFISVTSTTFAWDIHSNTLIGLIGLISLILLLFYNDSPLYILLIMIFNYCQGFINNICCNFLLEEFQFKYRELAFLLVSSLRMIGCLLYGLFEYIAFDKYNNDDPIISITCLAALQLGLTISLAFFYDSPRLLYYNNHSFQLYHYIKECNKDDNIVKYKDVIIKRIKSTKREIDECFPNQKYDNLFIHFVQLWNGPYLILSLKAIIFVFLSSFLMSNIKDSYSYFIDDKTQYLFIIDYENTPHYKICIYYLVVFLAVVAFSLIKFFFNLPRKYVSIVCLTLCFIFLILMVVVNENYIYFLCAFESLAFFYHMMVYMYFSTYITTQLRNSMTSLLYMTLSISFIFQSVLLNSMKNYTLFGYLNFGVAIILGFLEAFVLGKDTKDLKLQEIEISLLRANNRFIESND